MTEKDFILWLHGFFEISKATTLDENQVKIIKDHLDLFFEKKTPDRSILDDWLKSLPQIPDPNPSIWQGPYIIHNVPSPDFNADKVTCETTCEHQENSKTVC